MTRFDQESQTASVARRRLEPKQSGWREQIKRAFRSPVELLEHLGLDRAAAADLQPPAFPMLVPRAFADRMRHGQARDPLLLQVIPDPAERLEHPGFSSDPVGDHQSRRARGLLHKYAGRALLITTGACAIHCRYCFRQEFPYATDHAASGQWSDALGYIAEHRDIEEVILSGGDPLMLSTRALESLTDRLQHIPHLRRLRLHTRLPIVLPDRVTERLCAWISALPWPVVIVVHANHAQEFDADVDAALGRLRASGAHLLNQTVLLAGINDSEAALGDLMRRSLAAGVLPYYLHVLDRVRGAARFDRDRRHALRLHERLRIQLSGYLVPRLVREEAGAPYKLPVL
jgi:EF-P beta-lysylation protein EpmB